jgi:hypothetical protein
MQKKEQLEAFEKDFEYRLQLDLHYVLSLHLRNEQIDYGCLFLPGTPKINFESLRQNLAPP